MREPDAVSTSVRSEENPDGTDIRLTGFTAIERRPAAGAAGAAGGARSTEPSGTGPTAAVGAAPAGSANGRGPAGAPVGTPGAGFGACGEGYLRFSTFGDPEDTKEAAARIKALFGTVSGT